MHRHGFPHTCTNARANTKSICVWISVSLEPSTGISIDHLTSRRRVTDKKVWLCECRIGIEWKDGRGVGCLHVRLKGRKTEIHTSLAFTRLMCVTVVHSSVYICMHRNDRISWPTSCDWLSWQQYMPYSKGSWFRAVVCCGNEQRDW